MSASTIKFIHHRPFMDFQSKDKKLKRMYYNQATIAYTKPENGKCVIAYARCNDKDNYNKKIGRTIASNRLTRNGIVVDVEVGKHIVQITSLVKKFINEAALGSIHK